MREIQQKCRISLIFLSLGVRVETCKFFTLVYTLLKMCKIVGFVRLQCVCSAIILILNIQSLLKFLPFLLIRVPGEAVVIDERLYIPVSGKLHGIL